MSTLTRSYRHRGNSVLTGSSTHDARCSSLATQDAAPVATFAVGHTARPHPDGGLSIHDASGAPVARFFAEHRGAVDPSGKLAIHRSGEEPQLVAPRTTFTGDSLSQRLTALNKKYSEFWKRIPRRPHGAKP